MAGRRLLVRRCCIGISGPYLKIEPLRGLNGSRPGSLEPLTFLLVVLGWEWADPAHLFKNGRSGL